MVPEVVEEQQSVTEDAPAVRSTAVDKNGKVELSVTEMVDDEPGEDLSTTLGVENVCMRRRLPSGLLFWWIIAAEECVLIGATTALCCPQQPRPPPFSYAGLTRL